MWLRSKGRLRKEDQQYREWLHANSVRVIRLGAAHSKVPWQEHTNLQTQSHRNVVKRSNQFASVSAHEEARENEDRGVVLAVLNLSTLGMVDVV